MKVLSLVNLGLEKVALREIKELTGADASVKGSSLIFETDKLDNYFAHAQAVRRVCVYLGSFSSVEDLDLSTEDFNWEEYFKEDKSFKIEVDNVKGADNRLELARNTAQKFYDLFKEKLSFEPKLELKHPNILVILTKQDDKYYLGVSLSKEDINSRHYRVFTNPASFKGDFAYNLVRKLDVKAEEKVLFNFVKDGTIAIEAALFVNKIPLRGNIENGDENKIFATDVSRQNVTAARKNSQLAKTSQCLEINKFDLDELDVRYDKEYFDKLFFYLTTKDEDKINEVYYQAKYILKNGGMMMILTRDSFELSISDNFKLISEEILVRGDCQSKVWLLEKK
jgi:23S rRNA G2445 N2-methylase RlmL